MGTAAIGWLGLGVVLHLANQVARGQGWHAVIRAACPDTPVRRRDAVGAWVAGAGASGVLSARGGDGVRLLLLRPRTGEHGYPVLTGTLVAEGAGEAAIGFALLGAAFAAGISPGVGLPAPALLAVVAVVLVLLSLVPAVRRLAARIACGACALKRPGMYACRVLPWQVASRLARGLSIACFLMAFGLPATIPAVLLVMFAQVGGRTIPFAPASLGAGAAILAAAFEPVTGTAVSASTVATFFVVNSAVLTAVGVALAVGIAARYTPDYRWARQPVASWKRWLETRSPSSPRATPPTAQAPSVSSGQSVPAQSKY